MVRWFRRRRERSFTRDYASLLAATAKTLFEASVLAAAEISQAWPGKTGESRLSNEKTWSIQVELTWFFVAAICREVFNWQQGGPQARDTIQDDLVPEVLDQMLDRMFDLSHESLDERGEQAKKFLRWYNEAEMDYGSIFRVAPARDQIALEDNLAGKWAMRVATVTGQQENLALMVDLSANVMRAYMALNLPKCTVDLVQALQATGR